MGKKEGDVLMQKEFTLENLQAKADEVFVPSQLNCCESVLHAFNALAERPLPPEVVKLCSGFGYGMGAGKACGALCGAQMALGLLFGRERPGDENFFLNDDCNRLLAERFEECFGTIDCFALIDGYDHASAERKQLCCKFVAYAIEQAYLLAMEKKS